PFYLSLSSLSLSLFTSPSTSHIYTLSLHDALPIYPTAPRLSACARAVPHPGCRPRVVPCPPRARHAPAVHRAGVVLGRVACTHVRCLRTAGSREIGRWGQG